MSILKNAVVEDYDGIRHHAEFPASTKRIGMECVRIAYCGRVQGILRTSRCRVNCLECIADDH